MDSDWRIIEGYENYEINREGVVRRRDTHKIMADEVRGSDAYYKTVELSNGQTKKFSVHVLLAKAFIPNPDPEHKTQVDHIDRDYRNNSLENLRWVTPSENCQNRNNSKMGRNFDGKRLKHPVVRIDPQTLEEIRFESVCEAARSLFPKNKADLHTKTVNIQACCANKQKICCGYMWKYGGDIVKR